MVGDKQIELAVGAGLVLHEGKGTGLRGRVEGHHEAISEVQGHVIVSFINLFLDGLLVYGSLDRCGVVLNTLII